MTSQAAAVTSAMFQLVCFSQFPFSKTPHDISFYPLFTRPGSGTMISILVLVRCDLDVLLIDPIEFHGRNTPRFPALKRNWKG